MEGPLKRLLILSRSINKYTLHVGIHILIFFLAHRAKGNVGFWHHLASVVCCLSSVNFSHFNLLL